MSSPTPENIVRQFMLKMETLDYEAGLALVSPDVVYTNIPMGAVHGPDGIRSVLEPFFAPTISNEWVIKNVATSGNLVFMERIDRHQLPGGWAELPVVGVFEIANGLIVAWRDYFDLATIQNGFVTNMGGAA